MIRGYSRHLVDRAEDTRCLEVMTRRTVPFTCDFGKAHKKALLFSESRV